jgi:triosephosphate isomerase
MDVPKEFVSSLLIAYEPVWAIGTGKASSGKDARDVIHDIIRPVLLDMFGGDVTNSTRVLYGGSVTGANASEFLNFEDIDGALVGGASLKADEFVKIAQAGAG